MIYSHNSYFSHARIYKRWLGLGKRQGRWSAASAMRLKLHPLVLAGLVPAIHGPRQAPCQLPWMPGTRPGMDEKGLLRVHYLIASEHQQPGSLQYQVLGVAAVG